MVIQDFLADRQSKAGAGDPALLAGAAAHEAPEEGGLFIRLNPRSRVGDFHGHPIAVGGLLMSSAQTDAAARGSVIHGVGK